MTDIALKRAYAPATPEIDGYRILVDRLWPRGVSKTKAQLDEWLKDIAPSPQLRTWWNHDRARYSEFAARYRAELDNNPAVERLLTLMHEHADSRITLVFGAKDLVINHAHVLRNYLIEQTTPRENTVLNSQGFTIATIPTRPKHSGNAQHKKPNLDGLEYSTLELKDAQALQWVEALTFEDTFLLTSTPRDNDDCIAQTYTLENTQSELADNHSVHTALIDTASGEIAAFMKLNRPGAFSESNPKIPQDSIEVQRLYVMPRFKRRGLGSFLMSKAVDFAREEKVDWLWLGVWQYNFAAQEFYKNWGYERFSEHIFAVGEDEQVDFLLKKKLQ